MKIPKRQKISSVLWSKIFASHNSSYTTELYYGVGKGGSVNHSEFYGVEDFRCTHTTIQPEADTLDFSTHALQRNL